MDKYGVHPQLVADTHQYLYRTLGNAHSLSTSITSFKSKSLHRFIMLHYVMARSIEIPHSNTIIMNFDTDVYM